MAAGSWVVGGDCERGLEASERSWSREYEMRGVPPGVVPYTQAPEAELGAAAVRIGMVDDMVVRGLCCAAWRRGDDMNTVYKSRGALGEQ